MHFVADSWSISQAHTNTKMFNTRAQKWLAIVHCRIGVSTNTTLKGAKHFNNTSTISSFIHLHIYRDLAVGDKQRCSYIKFWGKQLTEKKVKNESDGAACKLFWSRFQKFCNAFSVRPVANCFTEFKSMICWLVLYQLYILLFVCLACTHCLHVGGGRRITRKYRNADVPCSTWKFFLLCKRVIPCLIEHPCSPTLIKYDESGLISKSFKNNNQQKKIEQNRSSGYRMADVSIF